MEDAQAIAALEAIVRQAADRALRWSVNRERLVVDEKSAGQFVSNADVEIEEQVRRALAAAFGDVRIVGEELGGELAEATGWAIDPIDGTSNFLLGLPIWGISVGRLDRGRSVLGAIALPALGLILSAGEGQGLRVDGKPVRGVRRLASVKVFALGENDFESGRESDLRAAALRNEGYAVVRYRCAVFSLASAAVGRLSGYVENGCGLWDIAAAEVICREAGMSVATAEVAEGRYRIDARWNEVQPAVAVESSQRPRTV